MNREKRLIHLRVVWLLHTLCLEFSTLLPGELLALSCRGEFEYASVRVSFSGNIVI
jgi:hypothetical protein